MAQKTITRNVFASKTGVLHVGHVSEENPERVFTCGTWKGTGKIVGASRILEAAKVTPAGTLTETEVNGRAQSYAYDAEAKHA